MLFIISLFNVRAIESAFLAYSSCLQFWVYGAGNQQEHRVPLYATSPDDPRHPTSRKIPLWDIF